MARIDNNRATKATAKQVKYHKPLSKDEAKLIKEKGISPDEYRYQQASAWAILMGEELPDKKQYMRELSDLKKNRK